MRKLLTGYMLVLKIVKNHCLPLGIVVFLLAILSGMLTPLSIYVNATIINRASNTSPVSSMIALFVAFGLITTVSNLLDDLGYGYFSTKFQMVIKTSVRSELLKKAARIKYEYYENEKSLEIIDHTFNNFDNAVRLIFPMYTVYFLSGLISIIGYIVITASQAWWIPLTLFVPFFSLYCSPIC